MDYEGRDGSDFHLNWGAHDYVACLLDQLGANLSEWSWLNDGDYIHAKTCRRWALLIRTNIHSLNEIALVGDNQEGATAYPMAAKGFFHSFAFGLTGRRMWRHNDIRSPTRFRVYSVSKDTRELLLSFAGFLDKCGGCEQW